MVFFQERGSNMFHLFQVRFHNCFVVVVIYLFIFQGKVLERWPLNIVSSYYIYVNEYILHSVPKRLNRTYIDLLH